jgi:hypothetical protein
MSDRARFQCDYCQERHHYAWQAAICCSPLNDLDDDDFDRSVN